MAIPTKKQWQADRDKKLGLKPSLTNKVSMGDEFDKYHNENKKLGLYDVNKRILILETLVNKIDIYTEAIDKNKNKFSSTIVKNSNKYFDE